MNERLVAKLTGLFLLDWTEGLPTRRVIKRRTTLIVSIRSDRLTLSREGQVNINKNKKDPG